MAAASARSVDDAAESLHLPGRLAQLGGDELLFVFRFLAPRDLAVVAQSCRALRRLPFDRRLWRELCRGRWGDEVLARPPADGHWKAEFKFRLEKDERERQFTRMMVLGGLGRRIGTASRLDEPVFDYYEERSRLSRPPTAERGPTPTRASSSSPPPPPTTTATTTPSWSSTPSAVSFNEPPALTFETRPDASATTGDLIRRQGTAVWSALAPATDDSSATAAATATASAAASASSPTPRRTLAPTRSLAEARRRLVDGAARRARSAMGSDATPAVSLRLDVGPDLRVMREFAASDTWQTVLDTVLITLFELGLANSNDQLVVEPRVPRAHLAPAFGDPARSLQVRDVSVCASAEMPGCRAWIGAGRCLVLMQEEERDEGSNTELALSFSLFLSSLSNRVTQELGIRGRTAIAVRLPAES